MARTPASTNWTHLLALLLLAGCGDGQRPEASQRVEVRVAVRSRSVLVGILKPFDEADSTTAPVNVAAFVRAFSTTLTNMDTTTIASLTLIGHADKRGLLPGKQHELGSNTALALARARAAQRWLLQGAPRLQAVVRNAALIGSDARYLGAHVPLSSLADDRCVEAYISTMTAALPQQPPPFLQEGSNWKEMFFVLLGTLLSLYVTIAYERYKRSEQMLHDFHKLRTDHVFGRPWQTTTEHLTKCYEHNLADIKALEQLEWEAGHMGHARVAYIFKTYWYFRYRTAARMEALLALSTPQRSTALSELQIHYDSSYRAFFQDIMEHLRIACLSYLLPWPTPLLHNWRLDPLAGEWFFEGSFDKGSVAQRFFDNMNQVPVYRPTVRRR